MLEDRNITFEEARLVAIALHKLVVLNMELVVEQGPGLNRIKERNCSLRMFWEPESEKKEI